MYHTLQLVLFDVALVATNPNIARTLEAIKSNMRYMQQRIVASSATDAKYISALRLPKKPCNCHISAMGLVYLRGH